MLRGRVGVRQSKLQSKYMLGNAGGVAMLRLVVVLASCLLLAVSVAPVWGGIGPVMTVAIDVQDSQGEPLDGVALVAKSLQREEVLLEDSAHTVRGSGALKVLTLHRFSIGAQLDGYIPVTLGPTYPSL